MLNLNFSYTGSTDARTIRYQRLSTRFYVISLSILLSIFVFYIALNKKSVTFIVTLLGQVQYEKLPLNYPATIICFCDEIFLDYQGFAELQLSF